MAEELGKPVLKQVRHIFKSEVSYCSGVTFRQCVYWPCQGGHLLGDLGRALTVHARSPGFESVSLGSRLLLRYCQVLQGFTVFDTKYSKPLAVDLHYDEI